MKTQFKNKRAFTLIELLIVIAIIGILFIVLVSRVDFATDKAKATGVQTDFRSFQMAFDTVAKENAGFNTFGFDTGDNGGGVASGDSITINGKAYTYTNADKDKGDGIRNSYDEGDTNLDGKNVGETWTGRKVYTETWNGIWTLVKPGTSGYDSNAIFALESAINKNLDPKLHITIAADGKITMANQARDPWKNEYHGYYITNAETDKGDRGAIVMYSNGANGKWGSAHIIENGVVTVGVPGNNVNGKDDYSLVSCYTFTNGYGEVLNMSTGFSNNQSFNGNTTNSPSVVPGGNGGNNGNEPAITTYGITFSDGVTLSWNDVMLMDNADKYGYRVGSIYETYVGFSAFDSNTQVVTLVSPNNVIKIDEYAFIGSSLKSVYLESVTTINEAGFANCTQLTSVVLSKKLTYLGTAAFAGCTSLNSIEFKGTIAEWNSVTKGDAWKDGVLATYVQCSDGRVDL